MEKPKHSYWCYPAHRPLPPCPACAWEAAVEAAVEAVKEELNRASLQNTGVDLRAVRERVK